MKNIGILTLQNADNYGAMCQMFALHSSIEKMRKGISEVINVYDPRIENRYKIFRFGNNFKSNIKQIVFSPFNYISKVKFDRFRNKAAYSPKISIEKLKDLHYDKIIVGSDQVWNITLTGMDSIYFLSWFSGKKYSYAASFGVSEFDKEFDNELVKLREFDRISVRERNAVDYLAVNGYVSQNNIDPSFLLNKIEWSSLAKKPKNEEYILIYTIGYSDEIVEFARELSSNNGNISIYYISNDILSKKGIKIIRGVGPEEWIGYFCNAKYIITNSFHGLAFAINFNIDFFYNDSMTTNKDTNARINSLLDIFDIHGRCIKEKNFDDIDWTYVNEIIENEKRKGFSYIKEIIGNNSD